MKTKIVALLIYYNSVCLGHSYGLVISSSLNDVFCPGEKLELFCSSNDTSEYLRWRLSRDGSLVHSSLTLSEDQTSGVLTYQGHNFSAALLSISPYINSSLNISSVELSWDGIRVECVTSHGYTAMKVINVANVLPALDLIRTTVYNETMDALVQLQWPALTYNDKSHFANYDISVNNQSWLLSTNVLNVTVPYNVNTTIRISAVDCQAFTILETFELVNCFNPSSANGVVIDPYSSTTEGSAIYYSCMQGFDKMKSVCHRNRTWNPDPAEHSCQKTCVFKVASNASILNVDPLQGNIDTFLFGGEVTFKCSEVGFPLGREFTAICNNSYYRIECFSTGDIFAIGGVSTTAAPIQLQYYLLLVAILCSVIFFVVGTLLGVCINWKKQHCIRCITALRSQQSNPSEEVVYDDIKTLNAEVTGNRLSGRGLSMSENVSYIEH